MSDTNRQGSEQPPLTPQQMYELDVASLLGMAEQLEDGLDNPTIVELMNETETRLAKALGRTSTSEAIEADAADTSANDDIEWVVTKLPTAGGSSQRPWTSNRRRAHQTSTFSSPTMARTYRNY